MAKSAFDDLLGDVPEPVVPASVDQRDASDALCGALMKSAKLDGDRFFAVLERERSLLAISTVVWALGGIADPRAVPFLLDALRDGDSLIRWSAASGLEKRRDARIVDGFIGALGDRAPNVRAIVVEALGKFRNKRALAPLREAAKKKSNANDAYLRKLFDQAIKKLA